MSPSISVVMSVYNGERYIRESVESILNQTYRDFEFILMDDASKDRTASLCRGYQKKDPRIRFYSNRENLGLTASLNKGIALAKGKWIARMDSDDVSVPERFEKQMAFLKKNPAVKLLGTRGYMVDEEGKRLSLIATPLKDKEIRRSLFSDNAFLLIE